jgi:hypothetical protein
MGNPEPSFNLKIEEGVETIPSGSTSKLLYFAGSALVLSFFLKRNMDMI